MSMRLMCNSLTVIKRCLAALDNLEDAGVMVANIRADLSALADELEMETEAQGRAAFARLERKELRRRRALAEGVDYDA